MLRLSKVAVLRVVGVRGPEEHLGGFEAPHEAAVYLPESDAVVLGELLDGQVDVGPSSQAEDELSAPLCLDGVVLFGVA